MIALAGFRQRCTVIRCSTHAAHSGLSASNRSQWLPHPEEEQQALEEEGQQQYQQLQYQQSLMQHLTELAPQLLGRPLCPSCRTALSSCRVAALPVGGCDAGCRPPSSGGSRGCACQPFRGSGYGSHSRSSTRPLNVALGCTPPPCLQTPAHHYRNHHQRWWWTAMQRVTFLPGWSSWPCRSPPAARCRCRYSAVSALRCIQFKIPGHEPEQLPPDLADRLRGLMAASAVGAAGGFLAAVCVRKGCIELTLDLEGGGADSAGAGAEPAGYPTGALAGEADGAAAGEAGAAGGSGSRAGLTAAPASAYAGVARVEFEAALLGPQQQQLHGEGGQRQQRPGTGGGSGGQSRSVGVLADRHVAPSSSPSPSSSFAAAAALPQCAFLPSPRGLPVITRVHPRVLRLQSGRPAPQQGQQQQGQQQGMPAEQGGAGVWGRDTATVATSGQGEDATQPVVPPAPSGRQPHQGPQGLEPCGGGAPAVRLLVEVLAPAPIGARLAELVPGPISAAAGATSAADVPSASGPLARVPTGLSSSSGGGPCVELLVRCSGRYIPVQIQLANTAGSGGGKEKDEDGGSPPTPQDVPLSGGGSAEVPRRATDAAEMHMSYTVTLLEPPPPADGVMLVDLRWCGRPAQVVPVVVLHLDKHMDEQQDEQQRKLAAELAAVAAVWTGPPYELDGLLYDVGGWMRCMAARRAIGSGGNIDAATAVNAAAGTDGDGTDGDGSGGGGRAAAPARDGARALYEPAHLPVLGASLLKFAHWSGLRAMAEVLQADMRGCGYTAPFMPLLLGRPPPSLPPPPPPQPLAARQLPQWVLGRLGCRRRPRRRAAAESHPSMPSPSPLPFLNRALRSCRCLAACLIDSGQPAGAAEQYEAFAESYGGAVSYLILLLDLLAPLELLAIHLLHHHGHHVHTAPPLGPGQTAPVALPDQPLLPLPQPLPPLSLFGWLAAAAAVVAALPSALAVAAWLLLPPAAWRRVAPQLRLLRHLGPLAGRLGPLLLLQLGWASGAGGPPSVVPAAPRYSLLDSLGPSSLLMEGLVLPVAVPLPPAAALLLAALRLPAYVAAWLAGAAAAAGAAEVGAAAAAAGLSNGVASAAAVLSVTLPGCAAVGGSTAAAAAEDLWGGGGGSGNGGGVYGGRGGGAMLAEAVFRALAVTATSLAVSLARHVYLRMRFERCRWQQAQQQMSTMMTMGPVRQGRQQRIGGVPKAGGGGGGGGGGGDAGASPAAAGSSGGGVL